MKGKVVERNSFDIRKCSISNAMLKEQKHFIMRGYEDILMI